MAIALDLSGRTALVTGASRGIGRAIALSLSDAGARVAVAARSEEELRALAAEVGDPELAFVVDLGEPGAPTDLAGRVLAVVDRVDILVNNAGIAYTRRTERTDAASISEVLRINLESALLLASALAPAMFDRGGCIVNVSSVSGVVGTPAQAIYAASKGGLDAATRSLACEWGPRGVRVNSVAPGFRAGAGASRSRHRWSWRRARAPLSGPCRNDPRICARRAPSSAPDRRADVTM